MYLCIYIGVVVGFRKPVAFWTYRSVSEILFLSRGVLRLLPVGCVVPRLHGQLDVSGPLPRGLRLGLICLEDTFMTYGLVMTAVTLLG
jgi:hypothetical protein